MEEKAWKVTLADGTSLEGLRLNGNNYISKTAITEATFAGRLSHVVISDGEKEEVHENMELVSCRKEGKEYWFILRDITPGELAALKTQANIEYIAMMADIDLEEV